jgi:hypothetical protein
MHCKHQTFEDKNQYSWEICYGLELFIIKDITFSLSWNSDSHGFESWSGRFSQCLEVVLQLTHV